MKKSWKPRPNMLSYLFISFIIINGVLAIAEGRSLALSRHEAEILTNSSSRSTMMPPFLVSDYRHNGLSEQENDVLMNTQKDLSSFLPTSQPSPSKEDHLTMNVVEVPDYIIRYPDGFTWIDANGDNFNTTVLEGSGQIREIIMPFAFPFYDRLFSTLYVTSLGWISFESITVERYLINGMDVFKNFQNGLYLPNIFAEYMIAPLISDFFDSVSLNKSELQVVLGLNGQMAVLTYCVEKSSYGAENTTFQVVLMNNGTILFNYRQLGDFLKNAFLTTSIGLNYGDGFVYSNVSLTTVVDEQNVTVKFDRINPQRDLAVTVAFSDFYYYEFNKSVSLTTYIANIGAQNITNFTAMLFMDGLMLWNVTFNGTNGEHLTPNQAIAHDFVLKNTVRLFHVNVTVVVMPLNKSTGTQRFQDDLPNNNRMEVQLKFANPSNRKITVRTMLVKDYKPLSAVQIKIEEVHGLLTLEGTTGQDGTVDLTGWMLKDPLNVTIKVEATHPTWGSKSSTHNFDYLSSFVSRGPITVFFGPGSMLITTSCTPQGTPYNLGFCPFTLTFIPQETVDNLLDVTVVVNNNAVITLARQDLIFVTNETTARTTIYAPVFRTDFNVITIHARWNDGNVTISDNVVVNGNDIRPLIKMDVGAFFRYQWNAFGFASYFLNMTVVEKIDNATLKVEYSFEVIQHRPVASSIVQGTMLVNIYNGMISNVSGFWGNQQLLPLGSDVMRFFFMLSIENMTEDVKGMLMPLYSWQIIYAITGLITDDEFGEVWLLNSRRSFGFGYAWYSKNTSVLAYIDTASFELILLDYVATSSLASPDEGRPEDESNLFSLFNVRIPSFTLVISMSSVIACVVLKKFHVRGKRSNNDNSRTSIN